LKIVNHNLKFKNTYRIESTRLRHWDYGSHGFYFITICTQNKENYFGNVVETHHDASLRYTEIGKIAHHYWTDIPNHFPFIELDEFIIMPNHIHGILFFNKPDYHNWTPNSFGPQSKNLASVVRGYKGAIKRYATLNSIDFNWQARYHDHIIQSEESLHTIRQYIMDNPIKWLTIKEV
jgi:putative transposase